MVGWLVSYLCPNNSNMNKKQEKSYAINKLRKKTIKVTLKAFS